MTSLLTPSSAQTTTTASFVQPAVNSTATISVSDASFLVVGAPIVIGTPSLGTAMFYMVSSLAGTSVGITNLGITSAGPGAGALASPGSTIPSGSLVSWSPMPAGTLSIPRLISGEFSGSTSMTNTAIHVVSSITLTTNTDAIVCAAFTLSSSDSGVPGQQVTFGISVNNNASITFPQLATMPPATTFAGTTVLGFSRILRLSGLPAGSNTFYLLAACGSTPSGSFPMGVSVEGVVQY